MADIRQLGGRSSGRMSAMLKAALLRARDGGSVVVAVHAQERVRYCERLLVDRLGATPDEMARIQFAAPGRDLRGSVRPLFRDNMLAGRP